MEKKIDNMALLELREKEFCLIVKAITEDHGNIKKRKDCEVPIQIFGLE